MSKKIAIVFLFILSLPAWAQTSEIKKNLMEGNYKIIQGPDTCSYGRLKWITEEGQNSLMVGPNLIIPQVDRGEQKEKVSEGCNFSYISKSNDTSITHEASRICKDSKFFIQITLNLDVNKKLKPQVNIKTFTKNDEKKEYTLIKECVLEKN